MIFLRMFITLTLVGGDSDKRSTSYENMVESFLDENTEFLEDYVRRKVFETVHFVKNKNKKRKKLLFEI